MYNVHGVVSKYYTSIQQSLRTVKVLNDEFQLWVVWGGERAIRSDQFSFRFDHFKLPLP